MQQVEGEASMMMSFRGGQQLCPSPIKAQANAGNTRTPAEEAVYAANHAMWMSSAGPRYGMPGYQQPPVAGNNFNHLQQRRTFEEVAAANHSVHAIEHQAADESHSESADRSFDLKMERKRPLFSQRCRSKRLLKTIADNASYLPRLPTKELLPKRRNPLIGSPRSVLIPAYKYNTHIRIIHPIITLGICILVPMLIPADMAIHPTAILRHRTNLI
jgi:hypothetical protein